MNHGIVLRVMSYGVLGGALAGAYLSALRWNIQLYVGRGHVWKPLLVHMLRLAVIVAAFVAFVREGSLPLLSGCGGFAAMRAVALHHSIFASNRVALGRAHAAPVSG